MIDTTALRHWAIWCSSSGVRKRLEFLGWVLREPDCEGLGGRLVLGKSKKEMRSVSSGDILRPTVMRRSRLAVGGATEPSLRKPGRQLPTLARTGPALAELCKKGLRGVQEEADTIRLK